MDLLQNETTNSLRKREPYGLAPWYGQWQNIWPLGFKLENSDLTFATNLNINSTKLHTTAHVK